MSDRPYVSFAEVKAKVTIPDAMEVLGIRDQFTEKIGVLSGVCPLPQHQHGPRPNNQQFKADAKKGRWLYKCFGDCAMHDHGGGDVIAFVKAMTQTDDAHVRFWFAERFGDRLTLKKNGQAKGANELNGNRPAFRQTRDTDFLGLWMVFVRHTLSFAVTWPKEEKGT